MSSVSPSSRARAPRARRAATSTAPRGTGSRHRRVSECGRPCARPKLRSRAADIRPCRRSECRSPGDATRRRDRRSAVRASAECRPLRNGHPASRVPRSTVAPPCPHCRGKAPRNDSGTRRSRRARRNGFRCDRSARRVSAVHRSCARYRRRRAGRSIRSFPRQGLRATASGWKCSSSRGAGPPLPRARWARVRASPNRARSWTMLLTRRRSMQCRPPSRPSDGVFPRRARASCRAPRNRHARSTVRARRVRRGTR